MVGSAGCQSATGRIRRGEPAAFGRWPNALLPHKLRLPYGSRHGAANYRLAACAPRNTRDGCASPKPDWTILHNKLPPTQRVGLVCRVAAVSDRRLFRRSEIAATARHIAQLSFFFLRRSFIARGLS